MPLDDTSRAKPANPPGIGHNNGPPMDAMPDWRLTCWRKAYRRAWKSPPRVVLMRQIRRAEELGLTHREYVLRWMDSGKWG